jgi:putative ABC transport system ATP-binding protein
MIELRDLLFRYPGSEFALSLDALIVDSGETVAIVGPSGSGKTTLLNLVAGLALPQVGEVRVGGEVLSNQGDIARRSFRINRIGMVFQTFELLEYLNVLDNILLPLRIGAGSKVTREARGRARWLADHVGIGGKLRRYPQQLSQGERQRVAVSRALLLRPRLVLADEPTGNLDPSNKGLVLDLLLDYVEDNGATLLTVTHDHELLSRFDRVLDISDINRWSGAPA